MKMVAEEGKKKRGVPPWGGLLYRRDIGRHRHSRCCNRLPIRKSQASIALGLRHRYPYRGK